MSKDLYAEFRKWLNHVKWPFCIKNYSDPLSHKYYHIDGSYDVGEVLAELKDIIVYSYKSDWIKRNFDETHEVFQLTKDDPLQKGIFLLFLVWYNSVPERVRHCPIKIIQFENVK